MYLSHRFTIVIDTEATGYVEAEVLAALDVPSANSGELPTLDAIEEIEIEPVFGETGRIWTLEELQKSNLRTLAHEIVLHTDEILYEDTDEIFNEADEAAADWAADQAFERARERRYGF